MPERPANRRISGSSVVRLCRERIAHYKCPTVVIRLDELPKTATGKIAKLAVREQIASQARC